MTATIPTVNVVSFSGGRTSAYLVHLMEQRRAAGESVFYTFMDTGAEHPKTYEFIRNVVEHWNIPLVCLRVVINPELGAANSYRVVDISEIGPDLQPWRDICSKYGTPYFGGPLCTRAMKTEVFQRYCADMFGKNSYVTWLGIRADEPRRLKERPGVRYLAEISSFEKSDVLEWWSGQPFDLQIPEHLGNCVFCIKKGLNKIALAARDEPVLAADFIQMINAPSVRVVDSRQLDTKIMYRKSNSLESVIALYADHSRAEIAATIRGGGGYNSGSCSESCEAIVCDISDEPAHVNAYCGTLDSLRKRPAHKLKEVGDQWRTPDLLFWGINAIFGPMVLDLFTDGDNSKCPNYYTAEQNALTQDWSARLADLGGAAFANPPYSRAQYHDGQAITGMTHIMSHARTMRDAGGRIVFLLKAAPSETWWPEDADHVTFIRGRVGFDLPAWFNPADEKQVPSSANFAAAIVVFDKTWRGERFGYIHRTDLEEKGRAALALARYAVNQNIHEEAAKCA
ncbi:TPA: phage N-6-adenine-methyltransferase [Salmonella enterica]|nr:phage N-6-adenine-methyltransferase [Salmonella enterica]